MVLSVAPYSSVVVGVSLFGEAFLGRVQLERPEEVVSLLEVGAERHNLVDEVFNTGNTVLSKGLLDDGVVSQGDSGAVDLAEAALVDKLSHCCLGGVAVSNVGLHSSKHVDGGLVQSHEHSVVQLPQSQQLHDLSALGVQLVDTTQQRLRRTVSNNRRLIKYGVFRIAKFYAKLTL